MAHSPCIKVLTYNIRKGAKPLTKRRMVAKIQEAITLEDAHIIFLQEVLDQDEERRRIARPQFFSPFLESQAKSLAGSHWMHTSFSKVRNYRHGHMGNAILSKFPIMTEEPLDMTVYPFEPRGLLYVAIQHDLWPKPIHCFCVHLSLFGPGRKKQLDWISSIISARVPDGDPLILAGDFNDWGQTACSQLHDVLQVEEAHVKHFEGRYAVSYPAKRPIFPLDRIYIRGMEVTMARVHNEIHWANLSDHVPVSAHLKAPWFQKLGLGTPSVKMEMSHWP